MKNNRGQITIFIIIAVIIVGTVILFFTFRDSFIIGRIPASIEPIYTTFLSCVEQNTLTGVSILESQAGYIYLPDFESGSAYMPFSSQLDFLGNPIPYWYYFSGSSIEKEQIPSEKEMEEQLGKFLEEEITACMFDEYYEQGFEITQGEPEAKITIKNNEIGVNLRMDLAIEKEEDNALINDHKLVVKSNLGALYNSAKKIYEYEQKNLFLEDYAVDILRLYAPVDGIELTCSPKIWNADEIFDELEKAIEANTLSLKTKGGSYSLRRKENEYFVVDVSVNEDVRFINSREWSNGFEVSPSEENILIANPIGNQPGLGILGFCYIPYHFVYNMRYPVLIQVSSGEEIFQFPVAVVIQGNMPRTFLDVSAVSGETPELCKYKNTMVEVSTYDTNLNFIEADISYECFGTKCNIGQTSLDSSLTKEFPQCVNGYILARAEGFEDAKYLYSVTQPGSLDIVLDKLYETTLDLKLDGKDYMGEAIISFISDKSSKIAVYPEQKTIELSEGQYEIQVYIYKNSSLKLGATTKEQCVEVPQSGFGGLLGLTREKCFDIEIPEQIISNALSGGGKETYYILESELQSSNVIEISASSLPLPESIEDLQDNYLLFEDKDLGVSFK